MHRCSRLTTCYRNLLFNNPINDLQLPLTFTSQRFFIVMQLPQAFLNSLEGVKGYDREAFTRVHEEGSQVTSIRINPAKAAGQFFWDKDAGNLAQGVPGSTPGTSSVPNGHLQLERIPWTEFGFYLPQRPSFTFDPLFHAGCYYVQEASSMFLEQVLRQLTDLSEPLKVLDLSAAPGGKSTHLLSLLSEDSLLVSNEVIRPRCNILIDNIIKWGYSNCIVTNNDPAAFKKIPGFFDVIVVDAPCSGSGLFRKDPEAISEWSVNNVALCSQRQQRILADVLPSLKENGLLIYSTCSYSEAEDESISDWLVKDLNMKSEHLQLNNAWGIVESLSSDDDSSGYRFYPDKVKGEGFFISCFRKIEEEKEPGGKLPRIETASIKEKEILNRWLKTDNIEIIKDHDSFRALPATFINNYSRLRGSLNIQYSGTELGQVMKERLVPHHALALSTLLSPYVDSTNLDYPEAIKYLQRKDLSTVPETKGWQTVSYENHPLGWINALANRINNYYPKEMRILKQSNDSAFEK
jgi:16S rRNA C967 or C1407 C5-methylase (RsmB/RsmF family)/NOL1/NOP2/fmu family ribosome biogenesis protein